MTRSGRWQGPRLSPRVTDNAQAGAAGRGTFYFKICSIQFCPGVAMLQKILVIFSKTKEWLLKYLNKLEIGESLTLFAHLHSFLSVQVIFINIYWHG